MRDVINILASCRVGPPFSAPKSFFSFFCTSALAPWSSHHLRLSCFQKESRPPQLPSKAAFFFGIQTPGFPPPSVQVLSVFFVAIPFYVCIGPEGKELGFSCSFLPSGVPAISDRVFETNEYFFTQYPFVSPLSLQHPYPSFFSFLGFSSGDIWLPW